MGNKAHKRSYAAFAREDVDDAKRGHPTSSLQQWAADRHLTYIGSSLPGQFSTVLPVWPDYVFNLCRGEVADGHFGYLAHELFETSADGDGSPSMTGSYHSLRFHGKSRGLLSLVGIDTKAIPNEPFAAHSFWLPTTRVGVRIPAATLLPATTIMSSERFPLAGNPKLDEGGLPGYRMTGSRWIDDALRLAITEACRPLAAINAPFAGVRIDHGLVAVFRNGFVDDPGTLNQMTAIAGRIADGLNRVTAGWLSPMPFHAALPSPDTSGWPGGYRRPEDNEADVLVRVATELGMVQEDPVAFHRAHPRCPAPGRALGLVRGVLPGTNVVGRVGFFEQGRHTRGTYRSVVMAPAREGAATPLGGALDAESDLYVEVADGVAYAWPRSRSAGSLNAAATVSAAVATARRLGLVDL